MSLHLKALLIFLGKTSHFFIIHALQRFINKYSRKWIFQTPISRQVTVQKHAAFLVYSMKEHTDAFDLVVGDNVEETKLLWLFSYGYQSHNT